MNHICIITGATGYIGSHLLKYLLSKGWDVYIIVQPEFGYSNIEDVIDQIDVFEYNQNIGKLVDYFKFVNAEVVFHLASAVITNYKPEQVPVLIQSNIQFGTEILEAMKYSSTRLFVGTGSNWQNYNDDVYNPVDLYAATKEAFEKVLKFYVDAHHFRAISLRLFDIYGEDDNRPKLWNLLKNIAGTDQYIDVSPGEQYLYMVHISDVCIAYEKAFEHLISNTFVTNDVYGIYPSNRRQLKSIIELFAKVLDKPINVHFGGKSYKEREVMTPYDGYKKLPNWEPMIDLEEGLRKFKH